LGHDEADSPGEGMCDDIVDITDDDSDAKSMVARNQERVTLMTRRAHLWKACVLSIRHQMNQMNQLGSLLMAACANRARKGQETSTEEPSSEDQTFDAMTVE
jgi:hypothetical protein